MFRVQDLQAYMFRLLLEYAVSGLHLCHLLRELINMVQHLATSRANR